MSEPCEHFIKRLRRELDFYEAWGVGTRMPALDRKGYDTIFHKPDPGMVPLAPTDLRRLIEEVEKRNV